MSVNIRFYIFRKERVNLPNVSVAACSPNGRTYSMKELGYIVKNYATNCRPKFTGDERPMISYFELEFEDYMYNAFLIAET